MPIPPSSRRDFKSFFFTISAISPSWVCEGISIPTEDFAEEVLAGGLGGNEVYGTEEIGDGGGDSS